MILAFVKIIIITKNYKYMFVDREKNKQCDVYTI